MASTIDGLPRVRPEDVGCDPKDIQAFLDEATAASDIELHGFMLYRSGGVAAEGWAWPYQPDLPHMLHSATKSFTSVAVGLAVHEGFFKLDDLVVSFFPDRVPKDASEYLYRMTVEDVLTQTSGHGHGESGGEWRSIETSWIDKFFSVPVDFEPGTKFTYSSATSFMLSAIISKTTGQPVRDFLEPRFFRPLGIKVVTWDIGPEGINPGGNGISCLTSDFLKLGVLHLQKGQWNGKQILPKEWVEAANKSQRGNEYGYHWWTDSEGSAWASGMFGQFAVVYPQHDAVLVTNAAVPSGARPLQALIHRHFPRILKDKAAVQESPEATQQLEKTIAALRVLPVFQKAPPSSGQQAVNRERFVAKDNEDGVVSFSLDFKSDSLCVFSLQDARGSHRVQVGLDDWLWGSTSISGAKLHHGYESTTVPVVAGGVWTAENTFEITMQYSEMAFCDKVLINFAKNYTTAKLERSVNVNSFGTRRPAVWASVLVKGDELQSSDFGIEESKATFSTGESTIGVLLDNPATRTILLEEVPDVVNNPRIDKGRLYTFDIIAHHIPGLDHETLARINKKLAQL
jgi:CubicO group peptidase (beta-lactamase class C family)